MHLNGRVYDPYLARFTSADTVTESPFSTQGWNRYSYVGNDPLAYTDPSGHCFLGCFWEHLGPVTSAAKAISNFVRNNAIVRAIVQVALNVALNVVTLGNFVLAAALSAAITTGLSGGNIGQMLKAGAIAGATAFAFNALGPAPSFASIAANPFSYAAYVGESAAVGCVSSVASGGSCGSGAAAAAVSAGLSPITSTAFPNAQSDIGERIGGTIVQATAGGLASVAGGGKFANGAVTGAFQYLASLPVSDSGSGAQTRSGDLREFSETLAFDRTEAAQAWQCVKSCAYENFGLDTVFGGAAVAAGQPILQKEAQRRKGRRLRRSFYQSGSLKGCLLECGHPPPSILSQARWWSVGSLGGGFPLSGGAWSVTMPPTSAIAPINAHRNKSRDAR